MKHYYDKIERINYEGAQTDNPFAFRHYNPSQIILGKTMAEHLRFSICYWHTFCWAGTDMFGSGSFNYPWQSSDDPLSNAKAKADVAFEFLYKMNVPFYAFHDVDVAPEGNSIQEYINNLSIMTDILLEKQQIGRASCRERV